MDPDAKETLLLKMLLRLFSDECKRQIRKHSNYYTKIFIWIVKWIHKYFHNTSTNIIKE